MKRGKFVVIYGPNNIGKTTQTKKIVDWLISKGIKASYLKYPIYDLEPTGPRLDGILRHKTETLSAIEIQKIFVQNRKDYEKILQNRLDSGEWIIAEDYKGTGLAWGMTFGVPKKELEKINKNLLEEDLAICMIGDRFLSAIEKGHLHEDGGNWEKNKEIHIKLAEEKGWNVVEANGSIRQVNGRIRKVIVKKYDKNFRID